MDRAKQKRIRNIRVIATNIFMSISVVAIVFVLMLVAMGFSFNENGGLEQSGLLQLSSHPSGASVEIDNSTQFGHTDFSKMLSSGKHSVYVDRSGYDHWQQDIKIDAGLLTRIEWIRLFPNNPEIEDAAEFKTPRLAAFSPDRRWLIVAEQDQTQLKRINIQEDKTKIEELNLATALGVKAERAKEGELEAIAWNENCHKVVLKWTEGEKTSWHLVDLEHADRSINLSKTFQLEFSSIHLANGSASKLWAVENGQLRLINVDDKRLSDVIAKDVESIANNRDVVSFVSFIRDANDQAKTHRELRLYKDGEESFTKIAELPEAINASVGVTMGSYWNEEWISYYANDKMVVLSGKYPSYGKDASSLKNRYDHELSFIPSITGINYNSRIALWAGSDKLCSFDIETKEIYDVDLAGTELKSLNWLDDFLLWQANSENQIIIRDFDGSNRRTIVKDSAAALPVVVSENNRFLYFFTANDNSLTLKREKLQ